tara:strand:+ start:8383 stop:8637 length:255 start_codon:yes stop_codon:yes gene_type:complete
MPTDPLPKESDTLITMPYKRRPYIRRRPYRRRIPKDTLVTMPKYRYVKPKPKPKPKAKPKAKAKPNEAKFKGAGLVFKRNKVIN